MQSPLSRGNREIQTPWNSSNRFSHVVCSGKGVATECHPYNLISLIKILKIVVVFDVVVCVIDDSFAVFMRL